jgi:L-threonylcarbamoyladenylate synthase
LPHLEIFMKKNVDMRLKKENALDSCIEILEEKGAVLLVPTDTVYGLVCRWNDTAAISAIREMKGRDGKKPFQMLAPNANAVASAGVAITPPIKRIMDAFCPGPLTIIAKKRDNSETIGFRIPDHAFLLELMHGIGANLAATSANLAGHPPIRSLSDADGLFTPPPKLAVDSGPLENAASTVVDATNNKMSIIREGAITAKMIAREVCLKHFKPLHQKSWGSASN